MLISIVLVLGFVIGVVVGTWWAMVFAVAFAIWIWATSEVEVPSWFLAIGYGSIAAAGIAVGVVTRRGINKRITR